MHDETMKEVEAPTDSAREPGLNRAADVLPRYSICIPNYNMADTLERALTSVLDQLDECYEVVVVDDGSTDESLQVLQSLAERYPILRVVSLKRDPKRKLGETRNITVTEARGEYVILHVDADDVWEPFIPDFVQVFHQLEACFQQDMLVSGQQINMGRRSFLQKYGPYRNLPRAQDIDLWWRLAADDAYLPLDHRVFRTRLRRDIKRTYLKEVADTWSRMIFDLASAEKSRRYVLQCFERIFRKTEVFSYKQRILRAVLVLPVYLKVNLSGKIDMPENLPNYRSFIAYRERKRGSFREILLREGCKPNFDLIEPNARFIFDLDER